MFLLVTAGLKLYGLGASDASRAGWFTEPWVQLLAAEWELVLGAWLLSAWQVRWSWLAALVTFVLFAGVSGYLGWVGVASCGCLGVVKTNPWQMFVADVVAITALAVSRPKGEAVSPAGAERGTWVAALGLVLGVATAGSAWLFGSPDVALARLRGHTLTATHPDFGTGKPGDVLEATTTVRNLTDRPVRLVGGTSDCSCTVLGDLPRTVEPHGAVTLSVSLHVPPSERGRLTRTVFLRTDDPAQQIVPFAIGCRIEP